MAESEFCPQMEGSYDAYEAEYFADDGYWRPIPISRNTQFGVPGPKHNGHLNCAIGLQGFEQAWALAWLYAAQRAAEGIEVRVQVAQYSVQYDLKAKRLDTALSMLSM